MTSIGGSAFEGCSSLTGITIPYSVTSIGWSAFEGCKQLRLLDLPASIRSVGHHAFADSGIKTLIVRNGSIYLKDTACLHGCRNYTIYAPEGSPASRYISERTKPLSELPAELSSLIPKVVKAKADALKGLTFVVTGDMKTWPDRAELKAFIENAGGRLTGSISGKTSYLITNDPDSGTTKIAKARQLGVQIIDEEAFLKLAGVK